MEFSRPVPSLMELAAAKVPMRPDADEPWHPIADVLQMADEKRARHVLDLRRLKSVFRSLLQVALKRDQRIDRFKYAVKMVPGEVSQKRARLLRNYEKRGRRSTRAVTQLVNIDYLHYMPRTSGV